MVSDSDRPHLRPDGLDDSGDLVAEHARKRPTIVVRHGTAIAVAQPAGLDRHDDLMRLRLDDVDLVDVQGSSDFEQDCCFHSCALR